MFTSPMAKLKARFDRFCAERDNLSESLGKAVREYLEPGYLYPIEYEGAPRFVSGGDESDEEHSSYDQPVAAFIDSDGALSVLCSGNVTWQMDEVVSDVSYMCVMLAALECDRRRRRVDNDTNREKLTR